MNPTPAPRQIVFLRHAQSKWNLAGRFTGWADVGLTPAGEAEARAAGQQLAGAGFVFDEAHGSLLARSQHTLELVLHAMGHQPIPSTSTWHLNERHYGALQGLDKRQIAARHGEAQFLRWRRGYLDKPPAMAWDDPRHPRFDPLYAWHPPELLPASESLEDTRRRASRYLEGTLIPRLRQGRRLLVGSHGNTLRALMMHLQGLSVSQVERLEIPTGTPLVCHFTARGGFVAADLLERPAQALAA